MSLAIRAPGYQQATLLRSPDAETRAGPGTSGYFRIALLLAGSQAALLIATGGPRWQTGVAVALSLAACFLGAHWWRIQADAALVRSAASPAAERDHLAALCGLLVPLWVRQLNTARAEGDGEIAEVSRAFGRIVSRLHAVLSAQDRTAHAEAGDPVLATVAASSADLEALVAALGALHENNQAMAREMAAESARLQESAAEIRRIALHTRMVSMNATIEAARAGTAGKGFAVIVTDMRSLADRTAEASDRCSSHAKGLHRMVEASVGSEGAGAGDGISVGWAQALAHQVIERFRSVTEELKRSVVGMERERRDIHEEIARALVALQVQDRVSQILSHLCRDLENMQADIASGRWRSMDADQWRDRMAGGFSTPEEFQNLEGRGEAAVRRQATSEVIFF